MTAGAENFDNCAQSSGKIGCFGAFLAPSEQLSTSRQIIQLTHPKQPSQLLQQGIQQHGPEDSDMQPQQQPQKQQQQSSSSHIQVIALPLPPENASMSDQQPSQQHTPQTLAWSNSIDVLSSTNHVSNISLLPNPSSQAVGIPSTGGSKTPSSGPMTDNSPTQSQQTVIHNEDGVSLPNAVSVVELNDRAGDFTKNEIKSTQNDSNHDNEIQPIFMENIGPKKIRVMALAGYEYRARDQRQKTRNQQRWVCRKLM